MSEYHKIQSLYRRDQATGKLKPDEWHDETYKFLAPCDWVFTEKIDGMNIRLVVDEQGFRVAGKTDRANLPGDLLQTCLKFGPAVLEAFQPGTVFYGEGYGPGIQKGGVYGKDKKFILFDVKIGDMWLNWAAVKGIGAKLGMDVVPERGVGPLKVAEDLVRSSMKSNWGDFIAEGLVVKPVMELRDARGGRIIAKIKERDYR